MISTCKPAISILTVVLLLFLTCVPFVQAGKSERKVLFREDFNDLSGWSRFFFPKIKKHTKYYIESSPDGSFLKTESFGSASAILYKKEFNVYEFPWLRFKVLVKNVYKAGDAKKKSGDDYPIRIYVMFKYDPGKAGFWERIKYKTAKVLYGEYPPYASLNYIWANKRHKEAVLENKYTSRAQMIPFGQGKEGLGQWIEVEVNMVDDYERAFEKRPPAVARIAIMNDSDNTGEKAVSLVDYLEVADRPVAKERPLR